jgi:hypothetical protein
LEEALDLSSDRMLNDEIYYENLAVYEILLSSLVQTDRTQMTV